MKQILSICALALALVVSGADAKKPVKKKTKPAKQITTAIPKPSFSARLLATHNSERTRLGLSALIWDEKLATSSNLWAQKLATSGEFEHDPATNFGENLWAGTKGAFGAEHMVQAWISERKDFIPGAFPNVSKTGNVSDVGHYTQIIWRDTKRVGCALASSRTQDVLVCRYDPPGNFEGEKVGK